MQVLLTPVTTHLCAHRFIERTFRPTRSTKLLKHETFCAIPSSHTQHISLEISDIWAEGLLAANFYESDDDSKLPLMSHPHIRSLHLLVGDNRALDSLS